MVWHLKRNTSKEGVREKEERKREREGGEKKREKLGDGWRAADVGGVLDRVNWREEERERGMEGGDELFVAAGRPSPFV